MNPPASAINPPTTHAAMINPEVWTRCATRYGLMKMPAPIGPTITAIDTPQSPGRRATRRSTEQHRLVRRRSEGTRSRSHPDGRGEAGQEIARPDAGDVGSALAGKLRSDPGRDHRRGRDSVLLPPAIQNPDGLN